MNDQDNFEEWYSAQNTEEIDYQDETKEINAQLYKAFNDCWKSYAELKDEIITAKSCENENLRELIAVLDSENKRQAKEIEALRGFCKSLCYIETYDETFNKASIESAKKFGLLDENGNPTNLLTGEKE